MDQQRRYITFMVLAVGILLFNMWLAPKLAKKPEAEKAQEKPVAAEKAKPAEVGAAAAPADAKSAPAKIAGPTAKIEPAWVALGSADPASEFRMLVTLSNRGAAVERMELNSPRYLEVENWEDRSGYLGRLEDIAAPDGKGLLVRVVGAGTPAGQAGLAAGDILTSVAGQKVATHAQLTLALHKTRPGEDIKIEALRDGKPHTFSPKLGHPPLAVVEPEGDDPLSYLLTLERLDGLKIADGDDELPGLAMRTAAWELLPGAKNDEAAFRWTLPEQGIEIVKRYRLARVPADKRNDPAFPAYHLELAIELKNAGKEKHTLAYRFDGPTGLPTEGSWYSYKISPNWRGGAGLRDVVVGFYDGKRPIDALVSCMSIIDKPQETWQDQPLRYIGVDTQYFAAAIVPKKSQPGTIQFEKEMPLRVGPVPADPALKNRTDVSCRIISRDLTLEPGAAPAPDEFRLFAGPKRPDLLAHYDLHELIQYGLFWWVARPMLGILHMFYAIIPNYGLAIVLLTVLVRSCMFPVSRRQAQNAAKMQELQPEIKRLNEKYKGNAEARTKAQQELFRKHSYNPLAGCLPVFLQLPIFVGLYRSLSVDVELRQAPLISESIRWCSNLAAPDMLWFWEPYLPKMLAAPTGWLGPYLNILPLVTIGLFLWQQKMFMPPPTDEQSAMQQKMMQYMMIFMSFMFFKVPSGLCLYFIASSLWGIAERKLLPKAGGPTGPTTIEVRSKPGGNGSGSRDRGRKSGKK